VLREPRIATEFSPKPVEWLPGWEGRLPRNELGIICGLPDLGKSLLAAFMAAQATRRGEIVYFSNAEDHPEKGPRPRLEAAGAILERVKLWTPSTFPTLPEDDQLLRRYIMKDNVDLILLDPFPVHLSVPLRQGQRIRKEVLNPLSEMAQETQTTVIGVVHGLKSVKGKANALDIVPGPYEGLAAAAQAIYLFGHHPSDEDERALVKIKLKLSEAPRAMTFSIDQTEIESNGWSIETPVLKRGDDQDLDVWAVVEASKRKTPRVPSKEEVAAEWLTSLLVAAGKPVETTAIKQEAQSAGISWATVRRAQ
jgi:putative DNA primase/helicase